MFIDEIFSSCNRNTCLFGELDCNQDVTIMQCDNQEVIHLAMDHLFHEMKRHIKVKHYFIRDIIV